MLTLTNMYKSYDGVTPVLENVSLTVDAGEIVCLLGPSGCGKTTLLRLVAGLETPEQGELRLHGDDLTRVPVHKRQFGLMFQEFALFPHKSVGENIAFGLRMARQPSPQVEQRVIEMLALVDLRGYADRSIFELSGGERQRVALARSLAPNPRLLMLDEPLGSLDRALREELLTELRSVLKRVGVTALYVTHDQEEAYAVADRLVVMRRGRIEQIGTPAQVYHQPATEFVARFLGFSNLVPATIYDSTPHTITTPIGDFPVSAPTQPGHGTLLIRPDAATLVTANSETDPESPIMTGKLTALSFRGDHYRATIAVPGVDKVYTLTLMFTHATPDLAAGDFAPDALVDLLISPERLTWLPASSVNWLAPTA